MTVTRDTADPRRIALLAALLDHATPPWPEGELPPLGHWLCFPPDARQSLLGPDGHPLRDDPDGLPRRMWAGGRVHFLAPVSLGAALERETTEIASVLKTGRSGRMRFVSLRHRIHANGILAIEEEQDLVYRAAFDPAAPAALPPAATPAPPPAITRTVLPDAAMLFRFSALTFNAHRIHYDRDYARTREGYPALVVHGPLIATLLMDHHLRSTPGARIASFGFRAIRPAFVDAPLTLGGTRLTQVSQLVAIDASGAVAMTASAGTT